MIWIYGFIATLCVVLWVVSKVLIVSSPKVSACYSKPFLASAVLIHKWAQLFEQRVLKKNVVNRIYIDRSLKSNLQKLNPGEKSDLQIVTYRIETVSVAILIVFVGSILGMIVSFKAENSGILQDGVRIERNNYGGASVNTNLVAGIEKEENAMETDIEVDIPARLYTYDEADELFNSMTQHLDEVIVGDNDSLNHVVSRLSMIKSMSGYPFSISWECSNYEYLDIDGAVHNKELEEPVVVTLTADCVYDHNHWYYSIPIRICPPDYTQEELLEQEILEAVYEADQNSAYSDSLSLPAQVGENRITWNERLRDDSPLLLPGIVILCMTLPALRNADIKKKVKKRAQELLHEYPSFVSKITLYLSAGMSVRNSFLTMGKNSENKPEDKRSSLDRELIVSAHELQLGISDDEVLDNFGKRCGGREYTRFVALLVQNMKKGSTDLIGILYEESENAFLLRKNEARKLGEEASTKLLLPMIMMLSVVMIIIMVPAYMSFST